MTVDVAYSLRPLRILFKIFAMMPYKEEDQRYKLSALEVIRTILYLGAYFAGYYFAFVVGDSRLDEMYAIFPNSRIIRFLIFSQEVATNFLVITAYVSPIINMKRYSEVVQKIREIDVEISKMGLQKEIYETYGSSRRHTIWMIVLFHGVLTFVATVFCVLITWRPNLLVNGLSQLAMAHCLVFYFVGLDVFEKRFDIINRSLLSKVADSNKKNKFPSNCYAFSNHIEHVVKVHKMLVVQCRSLNVVFSFNMLIIFILSFVGLVSNLYTIVSIFFQRKFYLEHILVDSGISLVRIVIQLFLVAHRSTTLCEKANQTKVIILGFKIHPEKVGARNTVITSTLRLMQSKLEISACKLFPIDNALLFSIGAAGSSYLFVMLQFELDSSGKTSALNTTNITNTTI